MTKLLLPLTVVMVALLAACGSDSSPAARQEVLVSAAASLTDAFTDMEAAFEEVYPHTDVVINLGGSSALREQILAGAPVDVFASANAENVAVVETERLTAAPAVIFATNHMEIAVPVGNPGGVVGIADFANPALLLGLCDRAVPCGGLAMQTLARAGVVPDPDTYEPDVRALLTKIEAGELDAGIVYATDVTARSGTVVGVEIPEDLNTIAEYPIVVLTGGDNVDGGAAFVAFVLSDTGRAILVDHGFSTP